MSTFLNMLDGRCFYEIHTWKYLVAENSPYLSIENVCEGMVHDMLQEEITLDEFRKLIQKI